MRIGRLKFGYVYSLGTLGTFDYIEFDFSTFVEGLETFHIKAGIMYKYVMSAFVTDETVTFLVVKPLNCTLHMIPPNRNIAVPVTAMFTIAHIKKDVNETGCSFLSFRIRPI